MMNIMKDTPSHEDKDLAQLRRMLDEAKVEVDHITRASRSLGDMVNLMSTMFDDIHKNRAGG